MSSLTPNQLGYRIFTAPQGGLGRIDAGLSSKDNELVFQILIQIALTGMHLKNISYPEMLTPDILASFNEYFMWLGYRLKVTEALPNNDSYKLYYCKIMNSNILRNVFHPISLMSKMSDDEIPLSFLNLLNNPNNLRDLFAIKKHENSAILFSFVPINIIIN